SLVSAMSIQPVLIDGQWIVSAGSKTFHATNPATKQPLPHQFPVSPWSEVEAALEAAAQTFEQTRQWPGVRFADFLEAYAVAIETDAEAIVTVVYEESGYPLVARLKTGELPRSTYQLRQSAAAARDGSWRQATIDTRAG